MNIMSKITPLRHSLQKLCSGTSGTPSKDIDYVRPAEIPEQDLYHGHSFITKWVFCQDAKVIGIQYFLTAVFTGIVGLILSWLMRLQLGYPESSSIYYCRTLLSVCNYAWNDNGSLFFNSFIFGWLWKLFNSFDGWCKRYGFSICKHA